MQVFFLYRLLLRNPDFKIESSKLKSKRGSRSAVEDIQCNHCPVPQLSDENCSDDIKGGVASKQ